MGKSCCFTYLLFLLAVNKRGEGLMYFYNWFGAIGDDVVFTFLWLSELRQKAMEES